MGSWNATCAVSHLTIQYNDPVRLIMLAKNPKSASRSAKPSGCLYTNDFWSPVSTTLKGTYNDYGCVKVEDSFLAQEFLTALRACVVPVATGENSSHDLACNSDLLTDMSVVQKLCGKRNGRVLIETRDKTRSHIGYMMVLEPVYQTMIESTYCYASGTLTPDLLMSQTKALVDQISGYTLAELFTKRYEIPDVYGISSLLDNSIENGSLATPELKGMSLGRLGDRLRINDLPDAALQDICDFALFHSNMDAARCLYGPTLNSGQDDDLDFFEKLNATRAAILSARRAKYDCDD